MLAFLLRGIDPDDWRKFKAECALRGLTIRAVLLDLIHSVANGEIKIAKEPKRTPRKD